MVRRKLMVLISALLAAHCMRAQQCVDADKLTAWPAGSAGAPQLSSPAYTSKPPNPFGDAQQCTGYAWARAYDAGHTSISVLGWPNQNARSFVNGGIVDHTPTPNSIAIWDNFWEYDNGVGAINKNGYSEYGHVAYVEAVDTLRDMVYFTEANVESPGYNGLKLMPRKAFENSRCLNLNRGPNPNPGSNPIRFIGYLHLSPTASPAAGKSPSPSSTLTTHPISAKTTVAKLPVVSWGSATAITALSATLSGGINPSGADTHYSFYYATNSQLSGALQTPAYDVGAGSATVPISANISGLTGNTTYYFQMMATNSAGSVKGLLSSFHTLAAAARPPAATTGSASAISTGTATVAGTVNPGGADTRYTFLYGANPSLAGASQTPQYDVGAGNSSLPISANLGGLSANTTYYFQLTASSSAGTGRGTVSSFRTAAPPPKPAPPVTPPKPKH